MTFTTLLHGCSRDTLKGDKQASPQFTVSGTSPPLDGSLESVEQFLRSGDLAGADAATRAALTQQPQSLEAGMLRVQFFLQSERIEEAVEFLEEMAGQHPASELQLRAQAADLLFQVGRSKDSIERFRQLTRQFPGDVPLMRRLAEILNRRGYRWEANHYLRQCAANTPLDLNELRSLIVPLRPWVDVSSKPSVDDLDSIRALGPLNACRAWLSQGDISECLDLYAQLEDSERSDPALIAIVAWASARAKNKELTKELLQVDAAQRYPEYWLAAGSLAESHDVALAASCYCEAIQRESNMLEAFQSLVALLRKQGQSDWATKLEERSQRVQDIQWLVAKIVSGSAPAVEAIPILAEALNETGQSLASLAWQDLLFSQHPAGASQSAILRTYKHRTLSRFPSGTDLQTLLCGYLDELPKRSATWLAELKSLDGDLPRPAVPLDPRFESGEATFVDVAPQCGLRFEYLNAAVPISREFQLFQAYGSGVACLDFDLDGRQDLYFGQGGCTPPLERSRFANALFRNRGGRVDDVTRASGADDRRYTTGITSGDWNQDGFPDLLIGNLEGNQLLVNQGDGTFLSRPLPRTWEETGYTTSVAIADMTHDSLPDLVVCRYLADPNVYAPIERDERGKPIFLPGPLHFQPAPDSIAVTAPDGTFTPTVIGDESVSASTGLGLIITDVLDPPGNEMLVANDLRANQFWSGDGRGNWDDSAVIRGLAYGESGRPMACMGIAAADFDNDAKLDFHITNFEKQWSNHYLQTSSGMFEDHVVSAGLGELSWSLLGFGAQAIDYDNNGTWDLVVGNGHIEDFSHEGRPFKMRTQVLAGDRSRFVEVDVSGDDAYWHAEHLTRGLAKLDWNQDGRVDFVTTELNGPARLFENRSETDHHWLQLELVGVSSERDAVGARVEVQTTRETLTQWVQTGDGYQCKNEYMLHFGLGDQTAVKTVRVRWPSGREQTWLDVASDQRLLLVEGDVEPWVRSKLEAR